MSLEVKVPTVGESISEVTIAVWHKKDGDFVEMDEVICELESDKATFELNAEASGILKTRANEGDTLEIGAIICEIDTEASDKGKAKESDQKDNKEEKEEKGKEKEKTSSSDDGNSSGEAQSTGEVKEMKVPTVGESINEVTIATWMKEDGEMVEMDEIIAEIESDKATFELNAEARGILRHEAKEGDTLEIGALLCKIEVMEGGEGSSSKKATDSSKASSESSKKESSDSSKESYATGHASPAAAKLLAEKGIDPSDVKGSGVDGRITKADAMEAEKKEKKSETPKAEKEKAETKGATPSPAGDRAERREKMSNLRKTISRRLVSVKNETAMLTTFNEVDMQPIMDIRKKYKESFKEKYEVGLGFMSFFTKACCLALQEWPAVNAKIDGEEMVFSDYCDISIAVSTPRGLVVPVVRNAEKLSFDQIEKEILRLALKARDNKLSIEEMTGGTFTITNGGVFGSMMSTPIINAPQSAILGMHNIVERAVVVNGEIVVRPMMYLALSYDHRIIDGRESVSFLVRVKQLLEDPARLLLGI